MGHAGVGGGVTERAGRRAESAAGRAFALLWGATLVLMGAWGWTAPLLAIYLHEAGLGLGSIGAIQAVTGIAAFLSQPWAGRLWDRWPRRRLLLVGAVAASAPVHAAVPLSRHPLALGTLVAATGVLTSVYTTLMFAAASSLAPAERSGRAFSAYRISGSIGWVLTSLSLGWVLGSIGVPGAYLLSAAAHAATALALWRWLPDAGLAPSRTAGGAQPTTGHVGPAGVLRMADVTLFLLGAALVTLSMQMGALYFPLYARVHLKTPDALFGVLMALPAALEVPFMLWLGRQADRRGVHGLLVAGAAVGAARWVLVTAAPGPLHLLPLQVLQSFAFSSLEILGVSFVARRLDPTIRGTGVGLLVSFQALGRIAAPLAGGAAGEAWGMRAIFVVAAGAAAAGAGFFAASGRLRRGCPGTAPESRASPLPARPGTGLPA